jgi:hypothetical protein
MGLVELSEAVLSAALLAWLLPDAALLPVESVDIMLFGELEVVAADESPP